MRRLALVTVFLSYLGCQCFFPTVVCPPGARCVSQDEFCATVDALAECGQARVCGRAALDAGCADLRLPTTKRCTPALLEASARGELQFDALAGGACLTSLETQCQPPLAQCSNVWRRTADAGVCAVDEACPADEWCDVSTGCPGACRPARVSGLVARRARQCATGVLALLVDGGSTCAPSVALSGDCGGNAEISRRSCAPGLVCIDINDGGLQCRVPGLSGAQCVANEACVPGFDCVAGRCTALSEWGQPCGPSAPRCKRGLACRGDVCAALVELGGACQASSDCVRETWCGPDGGCSVAATCGTSTDCPAGERCVGAQCRQPLDAGASCTAADICFEGTQCVSAVCAPQRCQE